MQFSVLIVDDDPRCRSAMAHAVMAAPDMRLAGVASDIAQGLALLDAHRPDVLLVDMALPSGSGIELIRHAAEHLPDCEVVVISVFGGDEQVVASIEAGATGYLLKDESDANLAEQIRVLRAGGSPISPVIARQLLKRVALPPPAPPAAAFTAAVAASPALSDQELKVLQLSAKGHTYAEIARSLGVSRETVLTYVKRSYRKLQVPLQGQCDREGAAGRPDPALRAGARSRHGLHVRLQRRLASGRSGLVDPTRNAGPRLAPATSAPRHTHWTSAS